jgi:uncharacterized SAM-binding protein YcdF (DUF218 family)
MFALSKIFFQLVKPGDLFLVLLLIAALLAWARRERLRRSSRLLLTALALAGIAIGALPLGNYALLPLESRFPLPRSLPARLDGIIVLGAPVDPRITAERDQVTLSGSATRLSEALRLARLHPEARILYTGGSGSLRYPEMREADAARRFFLEQGLDPARLVLERESRNTYENALFSARLVQPQPGQRWLLITSAMHMPRAIGVFRALGWPVIPYPTDYRTIPSGGTDYYFDFTEGIVALEDAAKEWLGLVAYRILGRTDSLFPGPAPR